MHLPDCSQRLDANTNPTRDENEPNGQSSECFKAPMSVWMIFVRWASGDDEPQHYDGRRQYVTRRLKPVGYNGCRSTKSANKDFCNRQYAACGYAGLRYALTCLKLQ